MRSRLWLKAFLFTFTIVASCTLVFTLSTLPTLREITTSLETRNAKDALDHVYRLVQAKHQEIESFREFALTAKKKQLKNITLVVEGFLRSLQAKVEAGELTKAEAQATALEQIRKFLYGKKDYVWVSNMDSVLISHPDPKLHNADFSEIRDVYGNLIVPPMVEVARNNGEGYTSYWWNRLGKEKPSEKLTYSRLFEPWDWVFGTGLYTDDIEEEVALRKKVLIGELKALMSSVTLGETGYMYIFDKNYDMIIHPNPNLEGKNFGQMENPASGKPIGRELVRAASTPESSLRYKWDRPEDPGEYEYDKISWVKHFDPFDWYLASSVYTRELHEASRIVTKRIVVTSVVALLVFSALAAVLIKRFMRPVEKLSQTAERVGEGELDVRSRVRGSDEIGVLGREFDHMVDQLQSHVRGLDAKVREKTEELQHKNECLQDANRQIMDSLDYTSRIQAAILPRMDALPPGASDMFAIWRPKEVIGGDFHWINPVEGGFFAAVVDCTGHGVPGAVMTMIAHMALSQAVAGASLDDPAAVLEKLDVRVRAALGQNGDKTPRDGLDIGLVGVDEASGRVVYAGGGVDLYLEHGGEVECIRADRRGIGSRSTRSAKRFSNQRFTPSPGSWLHLLSDGFIHQSGGGQGFPMGRSYAMRLLAECNRLSSEERKSHLLRSLVSFMGAEEQRDDITVLGLAIQPQQGADHARGHADVLQEPSQ